MTKKLARYAILTLAAIGAMAIIAAAIVGSKALAILRKLVVLRLKGLTDAQRLDIDNSLAATNTRLDTHLSASAGGAGERG